MQADGRVLQHFHVTTVKPLYQLVKDASAKDVAVPVRYCTHF